MRWMFLTVASLALLAGPVAAQDRTEVWDIVGRGPTTVRISNGVATIVDAAPVVQGFVASPVVGQGGVTEALDEVNAFRARNGLRPFLRDDNLTRGAMGCAQARAARLSFGHTANDFAFLPSGSACSATGCAAYGDSYGWMSCCARDNYTYAGAAWARGVDGKRYMSLFVR